MEQLVYEHPYFGQMYYLLQKPSKPGKVPLMLFLHGAGERGKDFEKIYVHAVPKYMRQGMEIPALVVCPQCPENFIWNNLVFLLKDFIDDLVKAYPVDESKIVITGISMGGYGTWEMLESFPGLFYKAAPVCGGGVGWRAGVIRTPVWAFHGDADNVVDVKNSYEMVDAVKRAGIEAHLTVFHSVGHFSWDEAYRNTRVLDWLLE